MVPKGAIMSFISIKKVLESVMREKDFTEHIEAYAIFAQWGDIVGEKVAAHTRPLRVSGTVLYVEVDDHVWFAQLKYMKADMLKRIERAIGPGLFRDLKFLLKGLQ